jgi:ubiquinone/menaquinone biosynthesis C-methylase UbiE
MHCLGGRVLKPELLDTLPEEQARASLADLVRINRRWGGHSSLRRLLEMAAPAGAFSLLDVGGASGDMAERVRAWRPQARVTVLDYAPSHLRVARGDRVAADAFRLPFGPRSFDYVFCSLFLHHFTDGQIVELLAAFGRVASRAVLALDLERHPVPYYFMKWSRPLLAWDPITVHDGAISVEAAFKARELEALARRAGLRNVRSAVWRPAFRIGLVGEAPDGL